MRAQLAPGQLTCVLTKQFYSQTEQGAGVKEKEMPSVPEELNVFRRPHGLMIKLVKDIERELSVTDFGDAESYLRLMSHLSTNFHVFQCHEDIENRYIVGELMPRLPCQHQAKLENDLHSDNRLSALVTLVSEGLQMEQCSEGERVNFGERLKTAIASFTVDFLPHMREEEEVFLPLLVEYFTETELKKLTRDVIELHHLNDPGEVSSSSDSEVGLETANTTTAAVVQRISLLHLPPEILLTILSHLGPRDLLRTSLTHSTLHQLSFDPRLWAHLHPVRWACGHWDFFSPPAFTLMSLCGREGEEVMGLHDAVIENDVAKELMSVEGSVNANLRGKKMMSSSRLLVEDEGGLYMEREAKVLSGLVEHVLPRVGSHTLSLDLAHGKAVSNAIVFRMLRLCPNLSYLDLSYTGISDFAFQGLLSSSHSHWRLTHVDLTGCSSVTDTSLQRLAQAISVPLPHSNPSRKCCGGGGCGKESRGGEEGGGGGCEKVGREDWQKGEGEVEKRQTMLQGLVLSGCHQITDVGLRTLAVGGGLPRLRYLNLSGLPNISERGLSDLTASCPSLPPELLFYCDNLAKGPYPDCASGCQNIGLSRLACCRANF